MALDLKLLAEIVAHPEDDAPRLVLADKLAEEGDARSELIVIQCALTDAGLLPSRRKDLRGRAAALLDAHEDWKAHVAGLRGFVFRRGFVDEVDADANALLPRAATLFANEPVTRLTLRAPGDALLALANANTFARVKTLVIQGTVGDAGARALAAALARREAPLHSLNVGSCGIGPDGAMALAGALTGCRTLVLTGNPIGDPGITAIAKAKGLSSLTALYVGEAEITDEGLTALAKGTLTSLARLALPRNFDITPDGLRALAKSKKLKQLRWLEWSDEDEGRQRVAVRAGRA